MIRSEAEAVDRKQRIRDRYKGVDTSELEVIPAKAVEGLGESTSIRRVAAYVRVSTDNDEQTSSYELQKNYYTEYIKAQPGWEFVGIYDDEGISGTSLEHRKGMQQLIEDCKAGKIDLVLTKSIARFARNIVDLPFGEAEQWKEHLPCRKCLRRADCPCYPQGRDRTLPVVERPHSG